jgi:hypothetical protein
MVLMASTSIKGEAVSLNSLFGQATYKIDYYQREYAWSREHVEKLIDDLFESFDDYRPYSRRRHDPGGEYFLGPFVYCDQDRSTRFLVDGQQRFTTLHLIFLHLRLMAKDLDDDRSVDKLTHVITSYREGRRTRFTIDIEEWANALEALYNGSDYRPPLLGSTLSLRNLWARSDEIGELLRNRIQADRLADFVDWLLGRVVLVAIRAASRNDGYQIFESMNDRGARLTAVDLLKSFLLSNVRRDEEKLNLRWREMLSELTVRRDDAGAPKEFLRAALIAQHADVSKPDDAEEISTILDIWVRRNAKDRLNLQHADQFFQFVDDLISLATHYRTFLAASQSIQKSQQLEAVFYNARNGIANQMILILAAVRPKDHDTTAMAKAGLIASFLDRLYVLRMLNDYPVLDRDFDEVTYRLVPLLRECRTAEDVAAVLANEIVGEDLSFTAIATYALRGNNVAQVRYLLARLTSYAEEGCRKPNELERYLTRPAEWHIEHLWPDLHKRYVAEEPDPLEFRTLRNRIGALGLLPGGDNSSLGALPLAEKIEFYATQNILLGALNATLHKGYPRIREFAKANGVENVFRPYGQKDTIRKIVSMRVELYRRLCERIWDPRRLGIDPKGTDQALSAQVPTAGNRSRGGPSAKRGGGLAASVSRGRSDYALMVRAGILTPGTRLVATYRKKDYAATIGGDGQLYFDNNDVGYPGPNEAGSIIKNTASCDGLAFWRVEDPDGNRVCLREIRDAARLSNRLPRGVSSRKQPSRAGAR